MESLEYYWIVFYENTLVNRVKHNLKNRELWGVPVRNIYPVTSVYSVLLGLFSLFFSCAFSSCLFFWEMLPLLVFEQQPAKRSQHPNVVFAAWPSTNLTEMTTEVEGFVLE